MQLLNLQPLRGDQVGGLVGHDGHDQRPDQGHKAGVIAGRGEVAPGRRAAWVAVVQDLLDNDIVRGQDVDQAANVVGVVSIGGKSTLNRMLESPLNKN